MDLDRRAHFRLGVHKGSMVEKVYKKASIQERHRHRFEFNNKFRAIFEKNGMDLSGICEERDLVEIIEIPDHMFFVGVQFHPEFKSKPMDPHPLFTQFVRSSLKNREQAKPTTRKATKTKRTSGYSAAAL